MMLKPFAMRMWYGNLRENSRITIVKVLEKIGEVWCIVFPFLNLKGQTKPHVIIFKHPPLIFINLEHAS